MINSDQFFRNARRRQREESINRNQSKPADKKTTADTYIIFVPEKDKSYFNITATGKDINIIKTTLADKKITAEEWKLFSKKDQEALSKAFKGNVPDEDNDLKACIYCEYGIIDDSAVVESRFFTIKYSGLSKSDKKKTEEMRLFMDDSWSGRQIAKLTGDNSFTDWLQDKDKVCTDGKDDGKIGFWEGAKCFAKGLFGGIPKTMINHPVAAAVTLGIGAVVTALTGGAILPVLGVLGVATGVGMAGYGTYKAITAKTDGEAKQAFETMGMGISTTSMSMASGGSALDKAAEAGVKSAEITKNANIFQKTVQMFKSIPECLSKSKEWTRFNLNIPISKVTNSYGEVTKKIYSNNSYREYAYGCDLTLKQLPNGTVKEY